jgi:hypothetical protein
LEGLDEIGLKGGGIGELVLRNEELVEIEQGLRPKGGERSATTNRAEDL